MKLSEFSAIRAACAYFFICPGLAYGLFTSRLPALKEQTGASEQQIGLILLCFGISSLVALFSSNWLIGRWGSRLILCMASVLVLTGVTLCGLTGSPLALGATCLLTGFGMALTDVAMNTQGIQVERYYSASCMNFMHASYSLGGVAGAMTAAIFAAMNLGMFVNAICALGLYACFIPWAYPKLLKDGPAAQVTKKPVPKHGIPLFIIVCGILSMLAYSAEGSVAEWGSLLLCTVKGASQATAAFVFAAFSAPTILGRLFGDRLRNYFGDFVLTFYGTLFATLGMAIVLFFANPYICLAGYAFMGIGLAPIVPILFSRAGSYPGVAAVRASAVVSLFAHGGLLVFPPLLGFAAQRYGLENALFSILAVCALITLGTIILKK